MTSHPTNGPTNDLGEALLDEVPAPRTNFWTGVDRRLASPTSSGDLAATSATQDITTVPGTPQPKRSRRWMPLGIAAAVVLLVAGFFTVQTLSGPTDEFAQNPLDVPRDERPGPTANRDHWHAAYGVWDCTANDGEGGWVEPFESNRDDYGIHSHGQGLIYIHPFFEEAARENATFSLFAETMGIVVDDDRLVLDDGTELTEGTTCSGEPAELRLLRWEFDLQLRNNPALPPLVVTENFGAERFYNDREVWILAFAPADAEIPMLPFERFQVLDDWLNGSVPVPPTGEDRIPFAREVPIADIYLASSPGAGQGPLAADLYAIRREANHETDSPEPAPGTINHLSTLNAGGLRLVDVFRYRSEQGQDCIATLSTQFGQPDGNTSCFDPVDSTQVVVSTSVDFVSAQGTNALNAVGIANPPADAEWMIVFTNEGERIVAPVLDDFVYAEWLARVGKPTRVQLLNATLDQLWASGSP